MFIFLFQLRHFSQLKNVDFYLTDLNEKIKLDSCRKIHKTFLIDEQVNNIDTFYSGVKEALNIKKINFLIVSEISHLSNCFVESIDNSVVGHNFMEESIIIPEIFDFRTGYNLIMIQRAIDSLGLEFMSNYGKRDSLKYELSDFLNEITGSISQYVVNDSTVRLVLDKNLVQKSHFKHLKGVVLKDSRTNKSFFENDFYSGVEFKMTNSRAFLNMNFDNYENSNFCLSNDVGHIVFQIPIRIE